MGQDTKRLLTGMLVALAVMIGYNYLLRALYPNWNPDQKPAPPAQVATSHPATTQVAGAPSTAATPTTTVATTRGAGGVTTAPVAWHARGESSPGMPLSAGSAAPEDKQYAMELNLVRRGAAIDSVTLNDFRKTAEDKSARYVFQDPLRVDGNLREETRSLETRSVTVDGHDIDLTNVNWKLDSSGPTGATFSVDILNGDTPVVRLIKSYKLSPRTDDPNTPQGYQVDVDNRFVNLTDKPVTVKANFNGPTVPPRELERQADQSFIFSYADEGYLKVFNHLVESEFTKEHTWKEFTKSDKGWPMAWMGTQSAYFNAIVRPVPTDGKALTAPWIAKVWGELLNPAVESSDERRVLMRMETSDLVVPAKETRQLALEVYFGPKARAVLNTPYYTELPRHYDETLVISGGYCGVCTWSWLVNVLVWMLAAFHFVIRDWGLAIIGLVLVVRAILHPITKKSQVHMVKMQKMGPEMEKLKKKYADDKDALAKAQMQFYKEQGFTPVLGCLPMFLQMPIWIALWNALQSTFELRHAPFLYGFTWIKDLSKPDYLVHFQNPIPLPFGWHLAGVNVLPILMAVVMYFQTKMQPRPTTMTPEQAQQQKMMTWMSTLLFPLMLYTGPSGLNLYIMTSTAFGIIEGKVIRKHIKEREELEKLGPQIVDDPPPGKRKPGKEPEAPKGWLARLQERAEEIRRQAEKKK
jgi:YidC/Oxa1 family membrane protein insertase